MQLNDICKVFSPTADTYFANDELYLILEFVRTGNQPKTSKKENDGNNSILHSRTARNDWNLLPILELNWDLAAINCDCSRFGIDRIIILNFTFSCSPGIWKFANFQYFSQFCRKNSSHRCAELGNGTTCAFLYKYMTSWSVFSYNSPHSQPFHRFLGLSFMLLENDAISKYYYSQYEAVRDYNINININIYAYCNTYWTVIQAKKG